MFLASFCYDVLVGVMQIDYVQLCVEITRLPPLCDRVPCLDPRLEPHLAFHPGERADASFQAKRLIRTQRRLLLLVDMDREASVILDAEDTTPPPTFPSAFSASLYCFSRR